MHVLGLGAEDGLLVARVGGALEEPADEAEPEPGEEPSEEDRPRAEPDEDEAEEPPGERDRPRRLEEVEPERAEPRAEDAPAVEREAREQVEDADRDVRGREVTEEGVGDARGFYELRDRGEDKRDGEAREGSRERDRSLVARRARLARDLAHAAEDEERDRAHLVAERAGDQRVRELVGEDRREEDERGEEPERERSSGREEAGDDAREVGGRAPGDDEEDEEPARVHPERDPAHRGDREPGCATTPRHGPGHDQLPPEEAQRAGRGRGVRGKNTRFASPNGVC